MGVPVIGVRWNGKDRCGCESAGTGTCTSTRVPREGERLLGADRYAKSNENP